MKEVTPYVMIEKDLFKMKEVSHRFKKDKEGNPCNIQLTANAKLLYKYMQDRHEFFKSNGKQFFDNQDDLAVACNLSRRSVINIIEDFVCVGLVEKSATFHRGAMHSNSYVVHDIFNKDFFITDATATQSVLKNKQTRKVETKPIEQEKKYTSPKPVYNDYEEENCPF